MELRSCLSTFLVFSGVDVSTMTTKQLIEEGRKKLFDFEYEIFDEAYKNVFETHFIRKFFMREIGFETEDRFKFELETWLMINMNYFNKLFKSELLTFDVFNNTKVDITQNKTNDKTSTNSQTTDAGSTNTTDGNGSSTSDGTNDKTKHNTTTGTETNDDFERRLQSDTPDNRLTITATDGTGVIEYASKIEEDNNNRSRDTSNTSDGTDNTVSHAESTDTSHVTSVSDSNVVSNGNGTINEIEDYIESKTGKIGSQTYASMLKEYRDSFLRIEKDIFKEMEKELFMLVY
jgi:hypothetical protein